MAHDEGYEQMERMRELLIVLRAISTWVKNNPGATAGDTAGRELLELVRDVAAKYEAAA